MRYPCKCVNMPSILLVEKSGSVKELAAKSLTEEDVYKKAGFKSPDGFECATTWTETVDTKSYVISLYGKTSGRAGQENKYDFPPPVDNILFFGTCVLLSRDNNGRIVDLTKAEWLKIYEHLFGGFEDLNDDEEEEASEDDTEEEALPRTKEGYAKDGFIVDDTVEDAEDEEDDEDEEEEDDDDEEDEEDDEDEEDEEDDLEDLEDDDEDEDDDEEEEEEEDDEDSDTGKKSKKPAKKIAATKKPTIKKHAAKPKKEFERITRSKTGAKPDSGNNYLNCSDELKEESYV